MAWRARCLALVAAAALASADSSSGGLGLGGGLKTRNYLSNGNKANWLNAPLASRQVITLSAPVRLTKKHVVSVPVAAPVHVAHPSGTPVGVPVANPAKVAPAPTAAVTLASQPQKVVVDVSLPPAEAVRTTVLLNTFEASQALDQHPLASAATGIASLTVAAPALPGGEYILNIQAQLLGLTSVPFATTLHGPAFIGQTGPAVYKLNALVNGTYAIPASVFRLMSTGQVYINVRTKKYPQGELRGQICFENCVVGVATGWQEVPIVRSKAFAVAQALLDQRTGALVVATIQSRGTFSSPVTGVELRFGAPGITTSKTPVTCPIVGEPPAGYPPNVGDSSNDNAGVTVTYKGYGYAGDYQAPAPVHVAANNPNIDTSNNNAEGTTLGQQPPKITLAYDGVDVQLFVCPAALSRENVRQLRAGLFFVNVRTVLYPNGEIRGQLVSPARLNSTNILAAYLQGQARNVTQTVTTTQQQAFTTTVATQVPVQVKVNVPTKVKVKVPVKQTKALENSNSPTELGVPGAGAQDDYSYSSSGGGTLYPAGTMPVRSNLRAGGAGVVTVQGGSPHTPPGVAYHTVYKIVNKTELRTEYRTVNQPVVKYKDVNVDTPVTRTLLSRGRGWELDVPLRLNPGFFVSQLSLRALSGKVLATEIRSAGSNDSGLNDNVLVPLPPLGPYAWHVFATGYNPAVPLQDGNGPVSPFPITPETVPPDTVPTEAESNYNDWSNSNAQQTTSPGVEHVPKDANQRTTVTDDGSSSSSSSAASTTASLMKGYAYNTAPHAVAYNQALKAKQHAAKTTYSKPGAAHTTYPSTPSNGAYPTTAAADYTQSNIYGLLVSGQTVKTVRTTTFPAYETNGSGNIPSTPEEVEAAVAAGDIQALGEVIGRIVPREGPAGSLVSSPTPPEQGKPPVGSPVPKKGITINAPLPSSNYDSSSSATPDANVAYIDTTQAYSTPDPISEDAIVAGAAEGVIAGPGSDSADGLVDSLPDGSDALPEPVPDDAAFA